MDREFTPDEQRIIDFHQQLIALSDSTEVAGRYILLGPDGTPVANGTLSAADLETATDALTSVNAYRAATDESTDLPPVPTVDLDPGLEAELEEYCIGLDAEFLMDLASQDTNSAVAAFDEITAQWDGGEL